MISSTDYLERGRALATTAESGLRSLLAEAAEDGDYDAVTHITMCAKQMRGIVDGFDSASPVVVSNGRGATRMPDSGEYPKFFRTEDKILMVGIAKKTNAEYEHRAPKSALDRLVLVLLEGTQSRDLMEPDVLLKRLHFEDGNLMPEYYGRTFLRWLRILKLVEKHGHSGYSVIDRESFQTDVARHWKRLPVKN